MSTVISVENLGKKYTLSHQQREPYTALRDVITNGVASFGKKLIQPFRRSLAPCPLPPSTSSGHRLDPEVEDFWALKDISFEVKQGDRIGIIGRNGAGKSTLLKILSRITEPTTGRVKIKGRVASLLEVGTGFHPELTGRENIYLNGAILGMHRAEIKKKFDEIVDFAEIEKFLDTPVKRYSSGMYVRLAFAVAAHLEPEILIVDEVLAVGDAQFQKKCLGKMEDVSAKEGRTVLFVSHNIGAVQQLCSKAIVLKSGYLAGIGNVAKYINLYIKTNAEQQPTYSNRMLKAASIKRMDQVTEGVFVGCRLVVELSLEIEDTSIGVDLIVKHNNKELFFAGSAYACEDLGLKSECIVEVTLGPVNFAVGCYTIDVNIVEPTHSLLEENFNVLEFEVHNTLPPNRYGFNLIADLGKSQLVMPQQWKVAE